MFGASDAANQQTLAALQRVRGGELVTIPDALGSAARFFDHETLADGVHARLRIRAVVGAALGSQAFLALTGADAVVFVPSGKADAGAWRAVQQHFTTYGEALVLVAAERAPRGITGIAVGRAQLADAIVREVVAAFRAGRIKGRPTTTPSAAYGARAKALAKASEIALAVGPRDMRAFHASTRAMALHPELGFATTSSLASLETAFFTYWNEASGAKVVAFWREVAKRRLPFKRRDVVGEVLAAGRIRNRGDYETVTDLISDERLTTAQRKRLGALLGAYEAARR